MGSMSACWPALGYACSLPLCAFHRNKRPAHSAAARKEAKTFGREASIPIVAPSELGVTAPAALRPRCICAWDTRTSLAILLLLPPPF